MRNITEVHYTPRELEIIKLFLMGFSRKEIENILEIAVATVNSHLKNLMRKTSCHSIADFIIYLFSHGFDVNTDQTEVTYNGQII